MISFRKGHRTIMRSVYWRDDIRWHGVGPRVDTSLQSHTLAYYLRGATINNKDLYVMMNMYWEPLEFEVRPPSLHRLGFAETSPPRSKKTAAGAVQSTLPALAPTTSSTPKTRSTWTTQQSPTNPTRRGWCTRSLRDRSWCWSRT
jgi:pullulanase/glycogen debranching enzyme